MTGFYCGACASWHDELPLRYTVEIPAAAARIPDVRWPGRVTLGAEQCVVDGRQFFVRATLPLPVLPGSDAVVWDVWVALSHGSYRHMADRWDVGGREADPPYSGRLAVELPGYPPTVDLPVVLHSGPSGRRAEAFVMEAGHPLFDEQRTGISLVRARHIAEAALHPQRSPVYHRLPGSSELVVSPTTRPDSSFTVRSATS
jgi:hypothetical protein